ncbi:MAG TPA: DCC1-like thiol-disulfide oxidoreductase family protein [Alphaproteobacteria bacterium]|nr:DCC1-like thiol-disulfide oxidoreductase family protein [Alphaproteobacteria bacterium]
MNARPLLVFDGVCVLCSGVLRLIMRADDKHHKLDYATAQSDLGQQKLAEYDYDLNEYETVLFITPNGEVFEKSDCVFQVCRTLGGIWKGLLIFKILPKSWRDGLYDFVAKRRYHWFGKSDYCERIPEKYLQRIIR